MKHAYAATLLTIASASALAVPSAEFRLCTKKAGNSEVQGTICYHQELAVQDARLNRAYQAVMKAGSPPEKLALRQEQRNWLKQRDRDCKGELGGEVVTHPRCIMEKTDQRADELENKLVY